MAAMAVDSLKGRLVVATPALPDPNFDRTVVLLLAHSEEGAAGVVLNRPSDMHVSEPLPKWDRLAAEPAVVFVGGPVGPGGAICLAVASPNRPGQAAPVGWTPLNDELGTLDLEQDPDELGAGIEAIRVFAGYAGWGAGQLEREIAAGAWFVIPAQTADVVSGEPLSLWKRVLRREGGRLAIVAAFPADPEQN
jgi:putative transcriptional regulator